VFARLGLIIEAYYLFGVDTSTCRVDAFLVRNMTFSIAETVSRAIDRNYCIHFVVVGPQYTFELLAVDVQDERVYFYNEEDNAVERVNLDGTEFRKVVKTGL